MHPYIYTAIHDLNDPKCCYVAEHFEHFLKSCKNCKTNQLEQLKINYVRNTLSASNQTLSQRTWVKSNAKISSKL